MRATAMKPPVKNRIRGLATVALLKTQYDLKQDHIGMFEPFLLDTISVRSADDFSLEELRQEFTEQHGLSVPAHPFGILLTRATREGHVRREGGRYFRNREKITRESIADSRSIVEKEHQRLAGELRGYVAEKDSVIESDEEALALLLAFLEENQIAFLLDDPESFSLIPPPALPQRDAALVAAFITSRCIVDEELKCYLSRMLEGFVLQNALLLRDISAISGSFDNLTAYLDTRFLLGALGMMGEAVRQAAHEGLQLLKNTKARVAVFESTVDEMKRVLNVYERHLGTSEGIRRLHPGPITSFVLKNRLSPSDMKQQIALLPESIRNLDVTIRPMPKHNPMFTLGEAELAKRIAGPEEDEDGPRVIHDVDCIASVLTLRANHQTSSLDDCGAIFATTTGLLVRNAVEWYRDEGGRGVPPVIHLHTLTSIAWLKRPAAAQQLKLHELVALCSAALRPSRELWEAFIQHLRALEKQGTLTSDEAVALVASEFTHSLLTDVHLAHGDPNDIDAATIAEVVDRVRSRYREDGDRKVAAAESAAAQRIEALEKNAAERLFASESEKAKIRREYEEQQERLTRKADRIAAFVARVAFIVVVALVVLSAFASWRGFRVQDRTLAFLLWLGGVIGTAYGLYTLVWGSSLDEWRDRGRTWLRAKVRALLAE